jgi:hypothetical protein
MLIISFNRPNLYRYILVCLITILGGPSVGSGDGSRLNLMKVLIASVTYYSYRVLYDFVSV